MKILIIGPIPKKLGGNSYGGIATHIQGLAEELEKNGHQVSLWYHKPAKSIKTDGIRVIGNSFWEYFRVFMKLREVFSGKYFYLSTLQRLVLSYQKAKLGRILGKFSFDVIHVHSLHNSSSIALRHINLHGAKLIVTDHGFWNHNDVMEGRDAVYEKLRESVKLAAKIIFISEQARKMHEAINFGQRKKLVKIKNPISIIESRPPKKQDSGNIIFFNGLTKSMEIKNLPILLKAIESNDMLKHKVKLIAIADKSGLKYIRDNNWSFPIQAHGKTSWDKIVGFYEKSDILVVPSKSDSFGLVYLEALMYGIPVVGLDSLIREFEMELKTYVGEGIDSKIETEKELAEKIISAMNMPFCQYATFSKLKEVYSWENNIHKFESVYRGN